MRLVSFLVLSLAWSMAEAALPNICLMVFQMADNNLEYYLRQDNLELIRSSAITAESLTTWVYYDGRDIDTSSSENIYSPLVGVWEKDGSELIRTKYSGSRYLTYNHEMSKMIVDSKLGEKNGDDPQTIYNFVKYALEDCIINRQTDEYMLILSSHGSGFFGYGGDENKSRRRKLMQSNESIVRALQLALASVDGAPSKFDVIGFDACLMSSFVALEEYKAVTKHFLASEATEPGHGWAYQELSDVTSALNMAKDLHNSYLQEKQGYLDHLAPKTMSLIDTDRFDTFHFSFEALSLLMKDILDARNDRDFYTLMQRARASVVTFESFLDNSGAENPSAVDIGSFLEYLKTLCNPISDTQLRGLLDDAIDKYDDMFVTRGIGPGTPAGTGMHVMWPLRSVYENNEWVFDTFLFENENAIYNAPNWFAFVQTYLNGKSPKNKNSAGDTCASSTAASTGQDSSTSTTTVVRDGPHLLLNPELEDTTRSMVTVKSQIAPETDFVFVEVGIDSSALVARRRLNSALKRPNQKESPILDQIRPHHRRLQQQRSRMASEDYFLLYLGSVKGTYDQNSFSAIWDRNFFFLGDNDNDLMPVYAYDEGNGARSVPVMYFPSNIRLVRDDIPIGTTLEEAVQLGGRFGSFKFGYNSSTREINTAFTLMTNTDNSPNSTITETPASAQGQIVPILYLDGKVDGYNYDVFLGGFDRTILSWSEENSIKIIVVSAENYLNAIPSVNTLLVDMLAMDFDDEDRDRVTFRIQSSVGGTSTKRTTNLLYQYPFSVMVWIFTGLVTMSSII